MFSPPDLLRTSIFAAAILASAPLAAHEFKSGDLSIGHPWTRVTPGGAKTGAGYLKVTNSGTSADRLVSATLDVAETTELHEMSMVNDVMRMRQLEGGVEIKPGETVELKPGGLHLMLIGLKQPFKEGELLKGALTFEKEGRVAVEFKVEAMGKKVGEEKSHSH